MSEVFVCSVVPDLPDFREILRYMRCKEGDPTVDGLAQRAVEICKPKLSYNACYSEFDVKIEGCSCDLGFARVDSRDLARRLAGCSRIVLFAATVGLGIDRMILRYGKSEPSLALAISAVGTERAEALCDSLCRHLRLDYAARGMSLTPRYSPGYGDVPLSLQRDIFAALGCERRIGLTLNDSRVMSPSKSVTAIIGIY